MTKVDRCSSCAFDRAADNPPRDRVHLGKGWRVAHAFGTALPGWLVMLPYRHVTSLDELTVDEAAELGPLLRSVSQALREVTDCEKTYVALFAEAEGFDHLHFHVVPRAVDLSPDLRGPYVFRLLGGGPSRDVPDSVRDEISFKLSAALADFLDPSTGKSG